MLQIRLSTVPPSEGGGGGGGAKPPQMESVTVACPDHLVLADLPVAKSLGSVTAAASSIVKTVGRRSRRQLGERVHFCVRCDYPIAIYGRLSPCEHAFCLDCSRSDSLCYLCDERIQKIQTIKLMEGIFVCAAPHCLKSFLKENEFESHIHNNHSDLLGRNTKKENTDNNEAVSVRKPAASDSTVQAPLRPVLSPSSNSQTHDREDKRTQPRDQQPTRLVTQPKSTPALYGQNQSQTQGYDGPSHQNRYPQQGFDTQPPNYAVPVNSNFAMVPPPFGYPPFGPNGPQPFYGAPFEMMRPDSGPEGGSEQGSLLGFPPVGMNFPESFPRGPWNVGPAGGMHVGSGPMVVQTDSQGVGMFQGDYGRNQGGVLPSPSNSGNSMDPKGILAAPPQPFQPPPPHLANLKRGNFYPADMAHDGQQQQGFGWHNEKRDSFGSGQD